MKNNVIPSTQINIQLDHLHSESKMQHSDEHTCRAQCRLKSKSMKLAIISTTVLISLMIMLIPIIWLLVISASDDEDEIPTALESSDSDIRDVRGFGYDKFGYQVDSGKIPEYRKFLFDPELARPVEP